MSTATALTASARTRGCHATSVREEVGIPDVVSDLAEVHADPVRRGGPATSPGRVGHALVDRAPSETMR
ncbi:hypothetical protein AB0B25_00370 [Nocardia sp. NPDC049190]|uniref:hypothetical protein n=1 Tax=Nocardia sp. NPDC049190 TaxID=3155650 RepID=UPI003408F398